MPSCPPHTTPVCPHTHSVLGVVKKIGWRLLFTAKVASPGGGVPVPPDRPSSRTIQTNMVEIPKRRAQNDSTSGQEVRLAAHPRSFAAGFHHAPCARCGVSDRRAGELGGEGGGNPKEEREKKRGGEDDCKWATGTHPKRRIGHTIRIAGTNQHGHQRDVARVSEAESYVRSLVKIKPKPRIRSMRCSSHCSCFWRSTPPARANRRRCWR